MSIAISRLSNWDEVRIFLAVAKHGSFIQAALELGTTQTTVGRRILELEERLGSKLLHRHGHGVRLTKRGMELAERAMAMASTAQQIERFLVSRDQSLDGTVNSNAALTIYLVQNPGQIIFRSANYKQL